MRRATKGSIGEKVWTYLSERRQAGYDMTSSGVYLKSLTHFAARKRHRGPITAALVIAWVQSSRQRRSHTFAHKLQALQPFLRFWNQRDPKNELVPSEYFGPTRGRIRPHIYTSKEIRQLIQTAFRLPNDPSRGEAYGTVFGLLAATGLRISEALTLRRRDVDLKQGVLTVADTKFKKTRYVPLHPSVLRALKRYARRRDEKPTNAGADYFFTISGRPLVLGTLESDFQKISSHLQWRSRGDRPRPRIHDLRHSFICRRIERWYAQGLNVNHLMLSLSTYVGHAMPSSTYWYLTVTPRLMALAARYSAQSRSQRTK